MKYRTTEGMRRGKESRTWDGYSGLVCWPPRGRRWAKRYYAKKRRKVARLAIEDQLDVGEMEAVGRICKVYQLCENEGWCDRNGRCYDEHLAWW